MRALLGLTILALLGAAPPRVEAQYPPPPGSYRRDCRDIRMEGQFLHATCRGARGEAQSSINVLSCSTDIGVDGEGGLICGGPGAGGPPPSVGPYPRPPGGYDPPSGDRWAAILYDRPDFRGRSVEVYGETRNLEATGFNDRVRSIRFSRRSGPWQVCANARFRGRCVTVDRSLGDTSAIGMADSISSLRPRR